MFYNLEYTNEHGESVKFEPAAQQFVDTNELPERDSSELRLVKFEGLGGVGADIQSSKSPNQDGSVMTNLTLEERYPYVEFMLVAGDFGLLSDQRRHLSKVFSPKATGVIKFSHGNQAYQLDVVPENAVAFGDEDSVGRTQMASVNFIAHDPYWRDTNEVKEEIARWVGKFSFPLAIPPAGIKMGERQPELIATITNDGDVATGMKIIFRADATVVNPSLFNVNTREYFNIEKTLTAGDQVVVTTGFQNKRVTLIRGGITSTLHDWDYTSTFMQLEPGDNLFRYDADDGLDNLSVDVYYSQKYMGV